MNPSHLRDVIDNEFKRVKIQNHPNYSTWYASLNTYAQLVVESILEEDVSLDIISFAQESPSDELEDYEFLSFLVQSDPSPDNMLSLTNNALEYILYDLIKF
ncbi:MAG TPA: hypothetical protein VK249_17045 [Anaerolineales bacterium]|nr:hypothetical protein [Anaerolineales bacterium]